MHDTVPVRVLAAMDKFKGTATSAELGEVVVAAARDRGADGCAVVVSDGGDGLLEAFGGANRTSTVTGPDGALLLAEWRLAEGTAVIESARACGLVLAGGSERNDAMAATSAGVGDLIEAAAVAGARRVIVGLGGTSCTDGGLPALAALSDATVRGVRDGSLGLTLCCDVTTRYVDAAARFGPQKGASPQQVSQLRDRLVDAQRVLLRRFGRDIAALPGSGAAGGLGGGLAAIGGQLHGGFDAVASVTGLGEAIAASDLVITGEGRLDETSFDGKAVSGVVELAARAGVTVVAIVGSSAPEVAAPFEVVSLTERFGPVEAFDETLRCVGDTAATVIDTYIARNRAK